MSKYYVSGCKYQDGDISTCDDGDAEFWTLYERMVDGTSQGVIDLKFREDAEAAMSVYIQRDALQQQVNQLAAENAKFLTLINNVIDNYEECEYNGYSSAVVDLDAISAIHTYLVRDVDGDNPFKETDAFLLNAQADGVDKLSGKQRSILSSSFTTKEVIYHSLIADAADEFAADLRAQATALQQKEGE